MTKSGGLAGEGRLSQGSELALIGSQLWGGPTIGWVVRALNESGKGDCGVESIAAINIDGKGQPSRGRNDIIAEETETPNPPLHRPQTFAHPVPAVPPANYRNDWRRKIGQWIEREDVQLGSKA